jgi:hypothetical protein
MRKVSLLIFLLSILFFEHAAGAFEERYDYLFHPSTGVYGFHPIDLFGKNILILSSTGSRLYSLSECNLAHASSYLSVSFMRIGMDVSYFGSGLYNENEFGISFLVGTHHLLGVKLKGMRMSIKDYGSRFFGGTDLLFCGRMDPFYSQSIYRNVLSYGYRSEEEKPTSSFSSLLKIYPDQWLSVNGRVVYSELTGTRFEIGNGIQISEKLSLGSGFNFTTRSISSLLSFSLPFSDLSYGISLHPQLGLTHSVGIVYVKRKKLEK